LKEDTIVSGLGTKANPYVVEVTRNDEEESVNLVDRIKERNKLVAQQEPRLTDTAGNVGDLDGLYESKETNSGKSTYYFRGIVENNYVTFADKTWRIVRINEDGTIRLILQDGINNNASYYLNNLSKDTYKLYYSNNFAKPVLEKWYLDNLKSYENMIVGGNHFCEQAKVRGGNDYTVGNAETTNYTSYTPNFKCERDANGYGSINNRIGLITYYEAWLAGSYPWRADGEFYLRNGQNFWTMSPSGIDTGNNSRVWSVGTGGSIGEGYVSNSYRVRPVINIKASVDATGVGSITNPYVLQVPKTEEIPNTLSEKVIPFHPSLNHFFPRVSFC